MQLVPSPLGRITTQQQLKCEDLSTLRMTASLSEADISHFMLDSLPCSEEARDSFHKKLEALSSLTTG
jgi:hypothetical protein